MGERSQPRFRLSIQAVMIAIVVIAIDTALYKALMHRPGKIKLVGAAVIVVAYNFLAYFTGLAVYQLIRTPRARGLGSWLGLIAAILVIGICAGLPLAYAFTELFSLG